MTDSLEKPRTAIEPSEDGGPPWRSGVGLIILNAAGETLLCERADGQGWQWPQGGRDEGETPLIAAWRELYEEIGLTAEDATLLTQLPARTEYDFPDYVHARHRELDGDKYVLKYRGQRHDWFLFRMTGDESRLRFDHHAEIEFSAYRWVAAAEACAIVTDFKRPAYQAAVAMLADYLQMPKINAATPRPAPRGRPDIA